jgi:hypothetical protein
MNHKIDPSLVTLAVPLADLTPDPRNARRHDERNVSEVVRSYDAHGQRKPIVVQRQADDGTKLVVRAGNGQCEAARKLGWTHIAAVIIDEGDADAISFALRDNRTAELAEWHLENLGESLRYLQDEGVEVASVGWEPYEAAPLMAAEWQKPNATDEDFVVPDKRVSLMFPSEQWDELKNVIGAKPTSEEVLRLVKIGQSAQKGILR